MNSVQGNQTTAPYIIAFDSFGGGVGKSTAIYNVGILMAASGRKALLIDIDFEKPGLTNLFAEQSSQLNYGVLPSGGVVGLLKDYLFFGKQDRERWAHRLQPDEVCNWPLPTGFNVPGTNGSLYLMPAGHHDPELYRDNLDDLIIDEGFKNLTTRGGQRQLAEDLRIELKKGNYDYILIDCPHGMSAMAALLADHEVVFSSLSNHHIAGTAYKFRQILSEWILEKFRGKEGDKNFDDYGKIVPVASIVPSDNYEARKKKINGLVDRIKNALGRPEMPYEMITIDYNPVVSLGHEQVVAHEDLKGSALSRSYHELHKTLRRICNDDFDKWTTRAASGWAEGDYELVAKSLASRKGLLFLNPDIESGANEYNTLLTMYFERLMRLPPEEFDNARPIAERIVVDFGDRERVIELSNRLLDSTKTTQKLS